MEIKIFKKIKMPLFIFFLSSLNIEANINKFESSKIQKFSEIDKLVHEYDLSFKKIYYKNDKGIELIMNQEAQSQNILQNQEKILTLNPNQYIRIKGVDNRYKLFNGSLMVKFHNIPDLELYANNNGLIFEDSLSDINRGIFKVSNLYDLDSKLQILNNDPNVLSIEFNTLDPLVKNN
jgi:hypothetical protein